MGCFQPGGRSRRKQHHGLRTEALMQGLGTRPDYRLRMFCKSWKNIIGIDCDRKNWSPASGLEPPTLRSMNHDYPNAPFHQMMTKWWNFGSYQTDFPTDIDLGHLSRGLKMRRVSCGWQTLVHSFLDALAQPRSQHCLSSETRTKTEAHRLLWVRGCTLAHITILRIFIKVWFSESISQYQRPSRPLAKWRGLSKGFNCLCYPLEYWVFLLFDGG